MKKISFVQLLKTAILLLIICLILFGFSAIFINGPVLKDKYEDTAIIEKIKKDSKCSLLEKTSFEYKVYSCINNDNLFVYDKNGKLIAKRNDYQNKLNNVEKKIDGKFEKYKNSKVRITFYNNTVAFIVECDNYILILDYDDGDVLFNSEDI